MDNAGEYQSWPFEAWLKLAVMQLGLTPSEFWNLSLIDWFALTRKSTPAPMGKDTLLKLEQDYADT